MKLLSKIALAAVMTGCIPTPVFACAACFGKSSDPLAFGMNWGIFTLLGIVALMLSSIATFFFFLIRREVAAREEKAAEENLSGAEI